MQRVRATFALTLATIITGFLAAACENTTPNNTANNGSNALPAAKYNYHSQ